MKAIIRLVPALVAGILASEIRAAPALQLVFPVAAEPTGQHTEAMASFRVPIGPFQGGEMTTVLAEGALQQNAWRLPAPQMTTLQLMQPLRDEISQAGFSVIYECETEACGGFDFRYGAGVLPEPEMHVDLGDFRYLAAKRGGDYLSLMVSRSPQDGFVQLTQIGAQAAVQTPAVAAQVVGTGAVAQGLDSGLPQVLEDLVFASGSSALVAGDYPSLRDLADWLRAHPDQTVMIVGHTDASGGLAANVAISKLRAQSVRQVLIDSLGVPRAQVAAEGVGPLAPRATNATEAGRQKNRRVEVLLTPTQ